MTLQIPHLVRRPLAAAAVAALALGANVPGAHASAPQTATHPGSAAVHVSPQARAVPFRTAEVTDTTDGAHRVTWSAPGVHRVAVYVATTPSARGRLLTTAGGSGSATIPASADGSRVFVRLVPDHGEELVVADRELGLASAPNFRDVGGYRTRSGQWVRTGLVYRTAQLTLSDADAAIVDKLGIGLDSDLRTDSEVAANPDVVPTGARFQQLNVMGTSDTGIGSVTSEADAQQAMMTIERQFVTGESAKAAYHTLFTDLATTTAPSLYHCTAGKDRTGWATAVLLTLLGVPEKTVMDDYLLSNTYYLDSPGVQAMLASMPPAQAAIYQHFMDVEPEYLQAGLDQVKETYGSMEAYARQGLGLSARTLAQLRAKMLVGAPTR